MLQNRFFNSVLFMFVSLILLLNATKSLVMSSTITMKSQHDANIRLKNCMNTTAQEIPIPMKTLLIFTYRFSIIGNNTTGTLNENCREISKWCSPFEREPWAIVENENCPDSFVCLILFKRVNVLVYKPCRCK